MKIFLDTGNLKEIEAMMPLGIVDGVTTNPSLMAKAGILQIAWYWMSWKPTDR